jgi:hypothetical protein
MQEFSIWCSCKTRGQSPHFAGIDDIEFVQSVGTDTLLSAGYAWQIVPDHAGVRGIGPRRGGSGKARRALKRGGDFPLPGARGGGSGNRGGFLL